MIKVMNMKKEEKQQAKASTTEKNNGSIKLSEALNGKFIQTISLLPYYTSHSDTYIYV